MSGLSCATHHRLSSVGNYTTEVPLSHTSFMADTNQDSYIVTARKWRPQEFSDVVGQDHITRTLSNAITHNRVHHAYLFTGPRGVGKTTSARIFARAINCSNPKGIEPCNECQPCRDMLDGRSIDITEIDGASNNSVDDIRGLRENSKYPPISSKYKVYIIDEVHMLSTSAFNALLKTLEEPPPHLIFLFATTEIHKVPATILSRCQRFDFKRMEPETIIAQLKKIAAAEKIGIDEESLVSIAKKADGSMRDSQSIFDQVVAFCGTDIRYSDVVSALHIIDLDIYFTTTNAVVEQDVATMFDLARRVGESGFDYQEFLVGLLEHLRNMLTVLATTSTSLLELSQGYKERYTAEALRFTQSDLLRLMTLVNTAERELRFSPQPRLRFELVLIQMALLPSAIDVSKVLGEIERLKSGGGAIRRDSVISPRQEVSEQEKKTLQSTVEPKVSLHSEKKSETDVATLVDPSIHTAREQSVGYASDASSATGTIQATVENSAETKTNSSEPTRTVRAESQEGQDLQLSGDVTAEKLQREWNIALVEFLAKERVVAMMLTAGNVAVQSHDGELVFVCDSSFVQNTLERQRRQLTEDCTRHFGAHVDIVVCIGNVATSQAIVAKNQPIIEETLAGNPYRSDVSPVEEIVSTVSTLSALSGASMSNDELLYSTPVQPPKKAIEPKSPARSREELHPLERDLVDLFNAKEIATKKISK